jgi:MATE family multidrug resistance protein
MSGSSSELPGGYRETLRVAFPLIVGMAAFTVMQFCDRIFLARQSSVSIQAALPAGVLSFTLICVFQSLAGYAGTFVAHSHGAGDAKGCVRATAQGLWLALLSWPAIVLLIPPGLWLMQVSGHAPDVLAAERVYFVWLMAGGVLVPLGAAVGGYFTGRGRMLANTLANGAGCALNVVLDYALIFGHWGFPCMGIRGAAVATVISSALAPTILLALFLRTPETRALGWRAALAPDLRLLRRIWRYGLPSGLHLLADVGTFSLFVMLTGRLGERAFAASNIGFSINSIAFTPLLGMGMAASILVGQYQGRRDAASAARAGWTALKLGWVYMLVVGLSFVLLPEGYYTLFGSRHASYSTAEMLELGRPMMYMMAAWGLFDTVNIVLAGALKGAGDTRFVMLYLFLMGWLLWIPGELLILARGGGILASWAWLTLYVLILSAGFWRRWRRGRWRSIDLLAREPPILPVRPGAEGLALSD